MERPNIKDFFPDKTLKEMKLIYKNSESLFSYVKELDKYIDYISSQLDAGVEPKIAGLIDKNKFKEIAEFVELEINEKHSNYWSSIAMGNDSDRFWHAYKKYVSNQHPILFE